jgi:hypothetical protein
MNAERLRELLDIYGGAAHNWPEELREDMHAALAADPSAQAWLSQARELDSLLDSYRPSVIDLTDRIVDQITRTRLDRLLDWLIPADPVDWWRPALAGTLPLVIGLALGMSTLELPMLNQTSSTDWELAERSLIAPLEWYEQTGTF